MEEKVCEKESQKASEMVMVEVEIKDLANKLEALRRRTREVLITIKYENNSVEKAEEVLERPQASTRFEEMRVRLREYMSQKICNEIMDDLNELYDLVRV